LKNFICSIFIFSFILGFAQNPYYQNIDKSSGLPSNSVYDIFQDHKGFIWFATGKGICRYDGSDFKIFTSDRQTSKSGSNIAEDPFGRIWYANFDGYLYYVEKNELKALKQPTSLGYFRFAILKNELFLVQPNAVLVYDLQTLKIKKKHSISDKVVKSCFAANDKFYVLGDFLYEFSTDRTFKKYTLPDTFNDDNRIPILSNQGKKIIINTKSGHLFYTFENGKFTRLKLNMPVNFIQNTSFTDHFLWICTPNGVIRNDFNSKEAKIYFTDQNISSVFKDKHGNYWISTLNKGVLFIQNFDNNFINLSPKPLSLSAGKDAIYIGAEKDLIYKLNYKTLQPEKVSESENNHAVTQIFADSINQQIYYTSFRFNILENKSKSSKNFSIAVKDIKKVDEKYFSFAASGISGIFYIDKNLKSEWDFIFNKNKTDKFSGFSQSFLLVNSNGKSTEYNPANHTIYYATNNGLFAVKPNGKTQEVKYRNQTLYLSKIQRYKEQILALSTNEKLYKIDTKNEIELLNLPVFIKNEKFSRFFIRENFCYLFSEKGIYEYNFSNEKTKKIMSLSNDFEATDVILKNNLLYFATSKGIVIKSRNETGNYPKPKLIINEIIVNGKQKYWGKSNEFNHNENDFSINFSVLSFIPNENYATFYKINDSDWKILEIDTKNLKLPALSSGKYSIELAINYNNQKIDIQKINFEIKKPFWLSFPFLLLPGLLLFLVFYLFYKNKIRKIERENQILLEKNELEKNMNISALKAIKSQMNPHFFYNALNTIQSFILSNDKKQAVYYLSKFSSLTRNILEMTEKDSVSISEEIETLSLYLDIEKARFDKDFEYTIKTKNITDPDLLKIPAMLLQPYVENAVKHGLLHKKGLKELSILFTKTAGKITIEIDDNGIGREKSTELHSIKNKKHSSFATQAMQNRVDILNKNKTIPIIINFVDKYSQNQQSAGTKVVIEIPINNSI